MINHINSLLDGFNIKGKCIFAKEHRHFSYYDIKLDLGTRISKLTRNVGELSLAMQTKTNIIITPIPEKGIVRLHTTNKDADILDFYSLYEQSSAPKDYYLPFLLGETAEGYPLWIDMSKNPHLLIAGNTGSGKSVLLHILIANAISRKDTKLYLIDTKKVEFNLYKSNCMKTFAYSVADDYVESMDILESIYLLMESRYQYMSEVGIQNVNQDPMLFDKIIVIIDEVADLLLYNKTKEFEQLIVKLAQKARAAGIYLVLATQRPSVDILTGLIKSNFPARISCKVSTKADSRIILDQHGAENLAGKGDSIIKAPFCNLTRFQSAFVNPYNIIDKIQKGYN